MTSSDNEKTCPQLNSNRALKCRRCLVRFEDCELAVVAPNFLIASGSLYRPLSRVHLPEVASDISAAAPSAATTQNTRSNSSIGISSKNSYSSVVATDSALNCALFHPKCFTCSTCREFLIDLVYCLRDNKLYCLRHYGDSIRPRCSWCQEVSLLLLLLFRKVCFVVCL